MGSGRFACVPSIVVEAWSCSSSSWPDLVTVPSALTIGIVRETTGIGVCLTLLRFDDGAGALEGI